MAGLEKAHYFERSQVGGQFTPLKTNKSHKSGTISIGNTSTPTIDFQGTFVRFPGECPFHC